MSLKSKPFWWVECDFPGCGVSAQEGSDYAAMSDIAGARESADDSDWWRSPAGLLDYCPDHPYVWSSDITEKTVTIPPSPPYLLIHDDDEGYEDNTVTLVETP